jgi:hypothetical protein
MGQQNSQRTTYNMKKKNSVALVRERTIPTEQPLLKIVTLVNNNLNSLKMQQIIETHSPHKHKKKISISRS